MATYYYHISSGGFASIIDKEGRDWISYHPDDEPVSGFKGRYRGIPNIAPPEFHPGTPEPKKSTRILNQGPVKISLLTETEDKKWQTRWDIYPDYATMTLLQKGQEPCWILYEGTPGGEFNAKDFWVRSDGTREILEPYLSKSQWTSRLPSPKWVYFGDHQLDRVLFYIHHEDYPYEDVFWQQLTSTPAHLTLGFSEKNDFVYVSERINAAYKPL